MCASADVYPWQLTFHRPHSRLLAHPRRPTRLDQNQEPFPSNSRSTYRPCYRFSTCRMAWPIGGSEGEGKVFIAHPLNYSAVVVEHAIRFLHRDSFFRTMAQARVDNSLDRTFRSSLSPYLLIIDDLVSTQPGTPPERPPPPPASCLPELP